MTNYEFYKEELGKLLVEHGYLSFAVIDGKIEWCGDCRKGCMFYASDRICSDLRREWLNAEYVEPINAENLYQGFNHFCDKHPICSSCSAHDASVDCKFVWIMENYNITKKGDEHNDKKC